MRKNVPIRQTTSVEQSERLMKLGFNKLSCDAYHWYAEGKYYTYFGEPTDDNAIPAWTLGKLFSLFNGFDININGNTVSFDGITHKKYNDIYDNIIDAIEFALNEGPTEYTFPSTISECIDNLNDSDILVDNVDSLNLLLICRNEYWRIMNYKPKYNAGDTEEKWCIYTFNGEIRLSCTAHRNAILSFPTEEVRDLFYKNFKTLIETCKQLL